MNKLHTKKKYFYYGLVLLVSVVFICQLFALQVVNNRYEKFADYNVIRNVTLYPARGNIIDRNGKILVTNKNSFNLAIVPAQAKTIDTTALCNVLQIDKNVFIQHILKIKKRIRSHKVNPYHSIVIAEDLPLAVFAELQEKMYKFPGYYLERRSVRKYPMQVAAHLLGYVGEVNKKELNTDNYYNLGDYIGKTGIEKYYEEALRGKKGVKKIYVDVHNRDRGSYQNGAFDSLAIQGKTLITGIDRNLQLLGEQLMQNKKGAIVAIVPATGEILALISAPTYNPGLLVGRNRGENIMALYADPNNPLYNRAIMDGYPPGSTFKVLNALIGLQEKVVSASTVYACYNGYRLSASHKVGCHSHRNADLRYSITTSCNAYYCNVFSTILRKYDNGEKGYNVWKNYVNNFGFGRQLETDIPFVKSGNIPKADYYNNLYGDGRWGASTIISLAIGQGEVQVNMLQLANFASIVANRGFYIEPHIAVSIGDSAITYTTHRVDVDRKYFALVIDGMYGAVNKPGGTAGIAAIDSIRVCGKTGTAQNPHGKDHSVFMAFAPQNNPKIAIAVLVENAGYGSSWAAPIASLMMEYYLTGTIKRQWLKSYVLKKSFINSKKSNQPDA